MFEKMSKALTREDIAGKRKILKQRFKFFFR